MLVKIKNKEIELKFTFNSFNYMEDFDISQLQLVESKPFVVIKVARVLLLGAINSNPKSKFTMDDVDAFIEKYVEDGESLIELIEELMNKLQESSFFKSLQKTEK